MNNSDPSGNSNEMLYVLMQLLRDDIQFVKNQQWTISYYGLLVFSGIVGVIKILEGNNKVIGCIGKSIISVSTLSVLIICFIYLFSLQNAGKTYRNIMEEIYKNNEIPIKFNKYVNQFQDSSKLLGNIATSWILSYILGLGAAGVFWILFQK